MTLRTFRERLERDETNYEKDDWGGCGCFAPVAQLRMDELLLTSDVLLECEKWSDPIRYCD